MDGEIVFLDLKLRRGTLDSIGSTELFLIKDVLFFVILRCNDDRK